MKIAGVLFDVGGVLFELDGVPSLAKLLQLHESHEAIPRLWMSSPSVVQHETGRMSAGDFAAGVVADLNLPISPEAFLLEFAGWLGQPCEGAFELVASIPETYQVAVLSNMSALHWERIVAMGLPARVERRFVSHETGHMKPSKEAFQLALSGMRLAPDEVLFLDDGNRNVNAAKELGLHACVVRNPSEVRSALKEYRVIL
jgi:FMN phosphatase YigB (HAD superfamily)